MHIFYFIFVQFPVLNFGLAHSGSQAFNLGCEKICMGEEFEGLGSRLAIQSSGNGKTNLSKHHKTRTTYIKEMHMHGG